METKIYLVRVDNDLPEIFFEQNKNPQYEEEFMKQAEKEGTVYSLWGFEQAFNSDEFNSENYWIKII